MDRYKLIADKADSAGDQDPSDVSTHPVHDAVSVTTCPHQSELKRYIRLQPVHEMLPGWVGTPASGR
ncbi:MAG: hypothetical protein HYZ59_03060 [Actinobacteria bacterium]|nr:hypothetical protein [Actinomycetota bacterium]